MKKMTLSLCSLTALCSVLALPALADTSTPLPRFQAGHAMHRGMWGKGMAANLQNLDTNKDGKISFDEFLAPRLARLDKQFTRLDKNGDGLISQDEIRVLPPRSGGTRSHHGSASPPALDRAALLACIQQTNPAFKLPDASDNEGITDYFASADSNGDGKLSLAELTAAVTARAQSRFTQLDANGDGFITKADIQANAAERAAIGKAMRACVKAQ